MAQDLHFINSDSLWIPNRFKACDEVDGAPTVRSLSSCFLFRYAHVHKIALGYHCRLCCALLSCPMATQSLLLTSFCLLLPCTCSATQQLNTADATAHCPTHLVSIYNPALSALKNLNPFTLPSSSTTSNVIALWHPLFLQELKHTQHH